MSGTFPTSPGYASLALTSNQPVIVSKSQSGKREARITSGHLWEMKVTFPPMLRAEFSPIDVFMLAQGGEYGSFDIEYTIENQGTWIADSALVNGAVSAGEVFVNLNNLTPGNTAVAGDFLRFAGHNKAYRILSTQTVNTADAILIEGTTDRLLVEGTTDALLVEDSNQITVELYPALTNDIANDEAVTHANVMFHMAVTNVHEFKATAPQLYRYELDLTEAL